MIYPLLINRAVCKGIGEDKKESISPETALKVIEIFRQDPISEKGKGAAALILQFAEESESVVVQLGTRNTPWLQTEVDVDISSRLMAAYIAGSVKSQLTKKTKKDDQLAGAEQVIESYQKIRKATPSVTVPSVDEWINLKAKGKLAEHFGEDKSKE